MDIKQLRYFIQVCRDKSFSNAAKNLYITQQGLSKAIKKLEENLHLPLFLRSNDGVKLTEYGKYLYEHSTPLIEEYNLLLQNLNNIANINQEKVRIGFSHGILNSISTEFLQDFSDAHKNIELVISEHSDLICEQLITENKIDMAFTIGPIDETKFHSISIKKERMCALINKNNSLSQKLSLDFTDLKDESISIINNEFRTYNNFINKCLEAGFTPNITFPVAEIMTVHRLSRINECVGISAFFVVNEIGSPNANAIPFNDTSFLWEICLITNKNSDLVSASKTFLNYALDNVQK